MDSCVCLFVCRALLVPCTYSRQTATKLTLTPIPGVDTVAEKKIVVIPFWIADTVHRNKMSLADVLDFEKIRRFCSPADLAGFAAVQDCATNLVGGDTHAGSWSLYQVWHESLRTEDGKSLLANTVNPLTFDESFVKDAKDRLFGEDSRNERYSEPFHYYDIAPAVGAMVISPGFYTAMAPEELHLHTVEAILKALYVYAPLDEVARSPWFRRWLELLSKKKVAVPA